MIKSIHSKLYLKARGIKRLFFLLSLSLFLVSPAWAANWYVSQTGAGAKNGTSIDNAWAGWSSINWDTDGAGPDTGVGAGDTLYVIGTLRSAAFNIYGYGLADNNRMTIASYTGNPGKLWQGKELPSGSWSGPDAYGAYSQACVGSYSDYAYEWDTDPWTNTPLTVMTGKPDASWTGKGLYYLDDANDIAYYKPTSSVKNITARSGTCRTLEFTSKSYITFVGLTVSNKFKATSSDYLTLENMDITGQVSFYTGCDYGIIRGCSIHDGGNGIYFINQAGPDSGNHNNWVVENNYIHNIHGTSDSHGIGIQGGSNNVFQYNSIYNTGTGMTFWNQTTQTMQNNTVRFNKINHVGYSGTVDGSTGRGIEFSGETGNSDLTTGNLVYGNVISDCNYASGGPDGVGIRIKNGIPTNGYSIKVFNNTISDCKYHFLIMPTNYESGEIGAYFFNNISINPKTSGFHVYMLRTGITQTYNIAMDKNIYYGTGSFYYGGYTGIGPYTETTLSAWVDRMKGVSDIIDDNSLATNPALNANLIPTAGGSGIGTGEDLSSLATLGLHPSTVFPTGVNNGKVITAAQSAFGSGWDIGAYIYQGNVTYIKPPTGLRVK